jgi:hypothetical protein
MVLNLTALLSGRPAPVPDGVGRVHRCEDLETDSNGNVVPEQTKRCPQCHEEKPQEDFYDRGDGRISSWCRRCTRAKQKARHAKLRAILDGNAGD